MDAGPKLKPRLSIEIISNHLSSDIIHIPHIQNKTSIYSGQKEFDTQLFMCHTRPSFLKMFVSKALIWEQEGY